MSRTRLIAAALTLVALAILMEWQFRRERQVRACIDGGGIWHGAQSACKHQQRPILQRDLHRS
jgi:hypothetical protein